MLSKVARQALHVRSTLRARGSCVHAASVASRSRLRASSFARASRWRSWSRRLIFFAAASSNSLVSKSCARRTPTTGPRPAR